jgi:heme oxygenase
MDDAASEQRRAANATDVSMGGLAVALRERTRDLHEQAERSGVVGELLRGRGDRFCYALLQRNLLPAYRALEQGLERHRNSPGVRAVTCAALYRSDALESDLVQLCGFAWRRQLTLLPAGERYARRIQGAGEGQGLRLIGHAYVRHLGDLSGGRILGALLRRRFALGPGSLAFHEFPAIDDVPSFKRNYRAALDRAGREIGNVDAVLAEGARAFAHNIELSRAVQKAVVDGRACSAAVG